MAKKYTTNEQKLSTWFKQMAYAKRGDSQFEKVIIRHVINKSKSGDVVGRFEVPELSERSADWDLDFAAAVISNLNTEASTLGGIQHYACYALFSGDDEPVGRCIVTVHGVGIDDGEDDLTSEPPTKGGLVSMAMRHQEANARILVGALTPILQSYKIQNERLIAQNDALMQSKFELLNEMSEVWDERKKQSVEQTREDVKTKAIQEGIETVRALAPVIINKIIGKDLLPTDKAAGITSMARSLYPSLTEEQAEALGKILRPDQLMQFYSMGEALLDDGKPADSGNAIEEKKSS
jgi:hypothetical protein